MSTIIIEGTSKVDINIEALQSTLVALSPEEYVGALTIKLDARGNVKSTFLKVIPSKDASAPTVATIYTGAIVSEGEDSFLASDGIGLDATKDIMLFVASLALVKAMGGQKFDMPPENMPTIRVDDDFKAIREGMDNIREKYESFLATAAPKKTLVTSSERSPSASKAANMNPHAGEELAEVPVHNIPEDLDLMGVPSENPFPNPEQQVAQNTGSTGEPEVLNLV